MKTPLAYCLGLTLCLAAPCWATAEPVAASVPDPMPAPQATPSANTTATVEAPLPAAPEPKPPASNPAAQDDVVTDTPPSEAVTADTAEPTPARNTGRQPAPPAEAHTPPPPPAEPRALRSPRLDRLEARLDQVGEEIAQLATPPPNETVTEVQHPLFPYTLAAALTLALLALAAALLALWGWRDGKRLRGRVIHLEAVVQRLEAQQKHLRGELDGGPDSSGTARAQVQLVRDAWQQTKQALIAAKAPAGEGERLKGAFERLLDLNPQTAQIGAQQIQSRARRIPAEALQQLATYGWPDNAVKGLLRAAYEDHRSAQTRADAHPPVPESGRVIQVDGQAVSLLRTAPADRPAAETDTLILAHGIGENLRSPLFAALAQALGRRGIAILRFNFPFAEAGKRGPDRDALMDQVYRGVIQALRTDAEWRPGRLFLGGRRLGARCASRLALDTPDIAGLVALSFDLHPQGKPNQLRRGLHLAQLPVPALYLCGELDRQCTPAALGKTVAANARVQVIEGVNPAFKPARIGATTEHQVIDRVAAIVQEWMTAQG